MRIAATAAAVLIAACATDAAAQDRPAAYVNAEACLEANVDAAVAASTGAADAAEFLLGYLCAGPVAAATKYEVNSELLTSVEGMVEGFLKLAPELDENDSMDSWEEFGIDGDQFGPATAEEAARQAGEAAAIAEAAARDAGSYEELYAGETAETAAGHSPTPAYELEDATPIFPEGASELIVVDPFEGISVDPVTGEIVTGDNPIGPMIVTLMDYMDAAGRSISNTPPVFLREHAARLIVQRRR